MVVSLGYSQNTPTSTGLADSIPTDSLVSNSDLIIANDSIVDVITKDTKAWPNPKKALLWSMVPGGGQIYNRRWWKLPLVYGAFVGIGYAIDYNQSRYRRLKTALDLKRKDETHEFSGTTLDDLTRLRVLRDEYDKNTQLAYVGIVFVYALQTVEAFVDAHLRNFDIEDDLGMRIKPYFDQENVLGQPLIGLSISIPLHNYNVRLPSNSH
ncbi:MAG: hypothetical protein DHS20C18_03260 [Saprospiraceae bacterium]|nr:MAG: hypothetical protein DHS20C18_03260 [Saprospiraceae bacterium]